MGQPSQGPDENNKNPWGGLRDSMITGDMVERLALGLNKELEGNSSCANCSEVNPGDKLLALGSDDKTGMVWDGTSLFARC